MIYFTQGSLGAGKTSALIDDCSNCEDSFCVLTFSKTQKELLVPKVLNGEVFSFDEFVFSLFKENFQMFKSVSDIENAAIINEIAEEEFASDSGLKNLIRSSSTGMTFYKFFAEFEQNSFSRDDFLKTADLLDISPIDKNRLRIVGTLWAKYEERLEQNSLMAPHLYIKKLLNQKNILKNVTFKKIFVDEIHCATEAEIRFLQVFKENSDLHLYGETTSQIEKLLAPDKIIRLNKTRNEEIMQRILLFLENKNADLLPAESIEYSVFEDISDEMAFIAEKIKTLFENGNLSFNDFAIAINKSELRHKMSDYLEALGIQTNLSSNLDNKNFVQRLTRFFEICDLLKQLRLEKFSLAAFAKARSFSKAAYEVQIEQLNLYFENLLSDIFDDFYIKDRFFKLANQRSDLCLLEIVEANKELLSEEKQIKFFSEIEALSALYKAFLEKRFFDFVNLIAARFEATNETEFKKFQKRFCTQVLGLENLCRDGIIKKFDFNLIFDISKRLSDENSITLNTVKILPFFAFAGQEFSYVFMPYMTENYFPVIKQEVNFLSPITIEKFLLKSNKTCPQNPFNIVLKKQTEKALFVGVLSKAIQKVVISTHKYEEKKMVLPSPFLSFLMQKDAANLHCEQQTQKEKIKVAVAMPGSEKNKLHKVVGDDVVLKINQSAISNFQKCPRKFYYKNLLNLQETSTFSASYGTIVHAVLEILYSKNLEKFSCERMKELAEILFAAKEMPQVALDAGFADLTIELVSNTSPLSLAEMKKNLVGALEELNINGFFDNIPQIALTEKSFEFELLEIPQTIFNGRVDAILGVDGGITVTDFKTGKAYSKKLEKYFEDENLDFLKNPKMAKEYQYQLPLYFLACEHANEFIEFKDDIKNFELKYIRPKNKGGLQIDSIGREIIEQKKEKLIENLKKTICEEIRNKVYFESLPDEFYCKNCQYGFVCDANCEEVEEE